MSMRTSDPRWLLLIATVLAGCSGQPSNPPEAPEALAGEEDDRVLCALGDEVEFTEQCDVERVQNGDRRELVMRHPDGGFRRFEIVTDGRGLAAADGAEEAVVTPLSDGRIQLTVGTDRYRMPATVKPLSGGG